MLHVVKMASLYSLAMTFLVIYFETVNFDLKEVSS